MLKDRVESRFSTQWERVDSLATMTGLGEEFGGQVIALLRRFVLEAGDTEEIPSIFALGLVKLAAPRFPEHHHDIVALLRELLGTRYLPARECIAGAVMLAKIGGVDGARTSSDKLEKIARDRTEDVETRLIAAGHLVDLDPSRRSTAEEVYEEVADDPRTRPSTRAEALRRQRETRQAPHPSLRRSLLKALQDEDFTVEQKLLVLTEPAKVADQPEDLRTLAHTVTELEGDPLVTDGQRKLLGELRRDVRRKVDRQNAWPDTPSVIAQDVETEVTQGW